MGQSFCRQLGRERRGSACQARNFSNAYAICVLPIGCCLPTKRITEAPSGANWTRSQLSFTFKPCVFSQSWPSNIWRASLQQNEEARRPNGEMAAPQRRSSLKSPSARISERLQGTESMAGEVGSEETRGP